MNLSRTIRSRAFSFMSENPRNASIPNSVANVAGSDPDVCEHFQMGGGKPPVFPVYCSTPITRLLCPSNILYFCSALIVPPEVPLRPGVQTTAGLPCLMTTRLISLLPETPAGAVPSTLFRRISGRPFL